MPLVDYAYDMAARGYKVFPLVPGGKVPAHKGWLLEATDDLARIEQLWSENPNYNIGVLTNGFVVVDLDTKKGDLVLPAFAARGGELDHTFTVRTASGGYHCYYNSGAQAGYEKSYHQAINKLATGIDIKSYHNYVVGPGSITATGRYDVINDIPTATIPYGFERDLRPAGQPIDRKDSAAIDTDSNVALAVDYIRNAVPAIEGQGGDNTTFSLAARLTRDYAISVPKAFELLQEWNERCSPPWEPDALYNKIVNASSYGQNDLGKRTVEGTIGNLAAQIQAIPEAPKVDHTTVPMPSIVDGEQPIDNYDFSELRFGNNTPLDQLTRRKWTVDGLLLEDQVTVLAGQGAAGKSTMELVFGLHFSLGLAVGPYKPLRPLRIMMYNAEDDIDEQTRRLLGAASLYGIDFGMAMQNIIVADSKKSDLMFIAENNRRLVVSRSNVDALQEFLIQNQIDIFMIDPMANIHAVSESDPTAMQRLMVILRQIAQRTHSSLLVAHHVNKASDGRKENVSAFRGSTVIPNATRNSLLLTHVDDADCLKWDIKKEEKEGWVKLTNVKANLTKKRTTFFKLNEVMIGVDRNTFQEPVAVLEYKKVRLREQKEEDELLGPKAPKMPKAPGAPVTPAEPDKAPVPKTDYSTFFDDAGEIMCCMFNTGSMPMSTCIQTMRERIPENERKSYKTYERVFTKYLADEGIMTAWGKLRVEKTGKQFMIVIE